MLLGVSAPKRKPKDANAEARGQKPIYTRAESQRSEVQRHSESKSGGLRLARSRLELEDK